MILITGTNLNSVILTVPPPTMIWASITPNMQLSNNNRTVTHTVNVSNDGAVGEISHSTGQFYFEVQIGGLVNPSLPYVPGIGLIITATAETSPSDADKWIYGTTGDVLHNGLILHSGGTTGPTAVIGWAVDFDTGKAFVSVNGTYQFSGNPVTEANPAFTFTPNTPMWPDTQMDSTLPSATLRGSLAQFLTPPPTGYSSWTGL